MFNLLFSRRQHPQLYDQKFLAVFLHAKIWFAVQYVPRTDPYVNEVSARRILSKNTHERKLVRVWLQISPTTE